MNILLLLLILLPASVAADDPYAKFDATHNMTNNSDIEWKQVNNIQATCESESKKRGLGGFGFSVEACSFWDIKFFKNHCVIYTTKKVDLETLGHEIRHCFQGAFHK